jgi:GTP cyclohydrolase I
MLENLKSQPHISSPSSHSSMPDVASETTLAHMGPLESVGMSGIEVPILWRDGNGETFRFSARADAFVNLTDSQARGIHMSRLFKEVQDGLLKRPLDLPLLGEIAQSFIATLADLSDRAEFAVSFEALLLRKALKSDNSGWRSYPVKLSVELKKGGQACYSTEVLVTYSSTCPASAALSRQLIQQNFKAHFGQAEVQSTDVYRWLGTSEGVSATPHAQRSLARVRVQTLGAFDFVSLIDLIEDTLATPVQTVVKREDEQEFALRNGQNLMFCEDAARRVKKVLDGLSLTGYFGEFRHVESLHPHDAVATIKK